MMFSVGNSRTLMDMILSSGISILISKRLVFYESLVPGAWCILNRNKKVLRKRT